jgi:threonine aldolase
MYAAMQSAPLGDDVLGDDPTVMELERKAAEITGMEATLFVASGTQGNQIAIATHCERGSAILAEEEAHILVYEVGAPAVLAGVVSWTLPSNRGVIDPDLIEKRFHVADLHHPGTTLLCLENTHNRHGGAVLPLEALQAYRAQVDRLGMKLHLDGARVWNAAVAQGVPVSAITSHFDSVSVCLSKGLCSPVGSVLCGTKDFIEQARRWRKRLGGGMRQAGILAACGLVSLNQMIDRLAEDHANAKRLAEGLQGLPGLNVDMLEVETNIVLIHTQLAADQWQDKLEATGVRCFSVAANRLRCVLHADVSAAGVEFAIEQFTKLAYSA